MKRLLSLLTLLFASPAFAQRFDLALVAGYTTPAGIEQKAAGISDLELAGSFTWGASLGWSFSPRFGLEASWARQQSALDTSTRDGSAKLFDVAVDQFHGSFVWQLGRDQSRTRPFLAAGAGASRFSAPQQKPETKLSFNVGGGLKWMATPRAGARLQVRYTPIRLDDSQSDYCDPFGFCQGWFHQLELTGGVVVRF